ncbi:hypothetical protein [Variovorax sp. DT-64]|uniref:hypothetical protein n=1 Tax=Variovorax sp. DT-64 TaxID=3396160 RepID=UPI003F1B2D15
MEVRFPPGLDVAGGVVSNNADGSCTESNTVQKYSLSRNFEERALSSYIFISPRSDPGMGRPLADPLLTSGSRPTMGTCRPDLRRLVRPGDQIFVISGSMGPKHRQYVIGGLEIAAKLEDQLAALREFPENALRFDAGKKMGNIIVTRDGYQHPEDTHPPETFENRIKNYLVGQNPVVLESPREVELGRERTIDILSGLFDRSGPRVAQIVGRHRKLTDEQADRLRRELMDIKREAAA